MTTILLLGSDEHERAPGHALVTDPPVQLHVTSENPELVGIEILHAVDPSDPAIVVALTRRVGANLVVVGPEAPLVTGVANAIREAGIDYLDSPTAAAELGGSKAPVEGVMRTVGMPITSARVCATSSEATAALDAYDPPYVVKNNGLAANKGVVVAPDRTAALAHAEAYGKVVVEEFLDGPELSLFAICDSATAVPLLPTQDFKRVGDDDAGPNTGGMRAYCPLPWAPDGLVEEVMTRVIAPTLTEMRRRSTPFTGLLYAELTLTTRGVWVVEFNVRFGDLETQAILALLETLLAGVLCATSRGELAGLPPLRWRGGAAMVVVEAARDYLGTPVEEGNIDLPASINRAWTVHVGVKAADRRFITSEGWVLEVVGLGEDLDQAHGRAYEHLSRVDFPDGFHRTNISIPC